MKKLIVVLGPHRSGTSLCTHAIQVLGAYTGLEELYASEENAKGFFEHKEIILFNEALLAKLGGSWDNPVFMAKSAIDKAELSELHQDAVALFQSLFGEAEFVVLKDPRMCQLLPFWEKVFTACGFSLEQIFYIHTLRHPVEVALSQQSRVLKNPIFYELGRNIEEGASLWLSLTAQSLMNTVGRHNLIVSYEKLLREPEACLQKIAAYLNLVPDKTEIAKFCQDFVDESLYRSKKDEHAETELQQLFPQAINMYDALSPLCKQGEFNDEDIAEVIEIFDDVETQNMLSMTLVEAVSRLSQRNREAQTKLVATYEKLAALKEEAESTKHGLDVVRRNFQTTLSVMVKKLLNPVGAITLRSWLYLRKNLVSLAMKASSRYPNAVHKLRRIVAPGIQLIDRFAFSVHAQSMTRNSDIDLSSFQQDGLIKNYQPLVTVIVPNYNHAPYLQQRLESIYLQSYQNFEVILMDDYSSDNSVALLTEYQEKYSDKTRLILNEQNSGGVFYQWEKGIQLAQGELIWIAESDDYCTDNFLETLVPMFRNEAVMLAYSRTDFIRNQDATPFWSINEYLHDIDDERWRRPFLETADEIVKSAFAIKNIIPNVSSAMFRKVEQLEILHDDAWKKMRTCGDWVLYLHLLRGGMIAYSPDAANYYRIHDSNTSVSSYSQDSFYIEHEQVATTLIQYYQVPDAVLKRQEKQLVSHWQQARTDYSESRFSECYNLERVHRLTVNKAANILIAGYAFCAGGGETFPILLANLMKARGYNVTFLDCNQVPRLAAVRASLRSDIPVVSELTYLRNMVKTFNIDLIHSQHAWVDCSVAEIIKEREPMDCQTVVTMHGMYEMMPDSSRDRCIKLLSKHTAHFVYTAEKNLGAFESFYKEKLPPITRIDNALDVYPFEALERASIGVPEEVFVLTLISRAVPEKGWSEAVESIKIAREKSGQDIHLILIGEGAAYDELQQQTLPDYIHLEGFRKNIRAYFAASDLGFLPSRFEGESFPLVIIDALHAGIPVLASAIGEIPYMLQTDAGPAGVLFDLTENWQIDTDVLAQKIAEIATDRTLYLQLKSNVPSAAAKFDPEHMTDAYDAVYKSAIAGEA